MHIKCRLQEELLVVTRDATKLKQDLSDANPALGLLEE